MLDFLLVALIAILLGAAVNISSAPKKAASNALGVLVPARAVHTTLRVPVREDAPDVVNALKNKTVHRCNAVYFKAVSYFS